MPKRLLFPVDMSPQSLSGLGFATQLAKLHDAKLCFICVASPTMPEEVMFGPEFDKQYVDELKKEFESLRPNDASVEFEHIFLRGNPGPQIVAQTKKADLCIVPSHGHSALMRLIMGSVAYYVFRHSKCPVVMIKGFDATEESERSIDDSLTYVTEVMHHVAPVNEHDELEKVLQQLNTAAETAAPVTDTMGRCIGILTTTDLQHHRELVERYEARDETVLPEMFDTDKYGHVRCENRDFNLVKRHMTKDVVSVRTSDSIQTAIKVFESNPTIHHLVVLDEDQQPVGILNSNQINELGLKDHRQGLAP